MTNRTEMLHFRATPEEKQTIRENAGHAELALSEWMRQRSLDGLIPAFEDPVTRENKAKVRQACEEGKPVDAQVVSGSSAPTQPAVEEPDGARFPDDPTGAVAEALGETYEQFMERRVGELLGDDASAEAQGQAQTTARAEWIASRPKEKK